MKFQAIEYLIEGDYFDVLSTCWGNTIQECKDKYDNMYWYRKGKKTIGKRHDDKSVKVVISRNDGKAEAYTFGMMEVTS